MKLEGFFWIMQSGFNRSCKEIFVEKSDKTIIFYLQLTIRLKGSLAKQRQDRFYKFHFQVNGLRYEAV